MVKTSPLIFHYLNECVQNWEECWVVVVRYDIEGIKIKWNPSEIFFLLPVKLNLSYTNKNTNKKQGRTFPVWQPQDSEQQFPLPEL